jgi:hypothetical protein
MRALYLILFTPALTVLTLAIIWRCVIHWKPFGARGWLIISSIVVLIGVAFPLFCGVWVLDIAGKRHVLCKATTPTGYQVSIVQYWNHVDFYTTEARVTSPAGVTSIIVLDGDADKSWTASLEIDPSRNIANYRVPDGRSGTLTW